MSILTIRATDIEDEDAGWLRGCKIINVSFEESGVTFVIGMDDDEGW